MRYLNPVHTVVHTVAIFALLLSLAIGLQAQAQSSGATARTVVGGSLTAAGIAFVPIYTEYTLSVGDEGSPYMALMVPMFLTTGIPTLVTGAVQLGQGSSRLTDPANVEAWGRATSGKLCIPYLLVGGLAAGIGLPIAMQGWSDGRYSGAPSFVLPATGLALFGAGVYIATSSDNALRELWGKEPEIEDRPGEFLVTGGVICLAMGTGVLVGMAPAMRVTFGDPEAVLTASILGAGYFAGGLAMLISGVGRLVSANEVSAWTAARRSRVVLRSVGPMHDPMTGTTGIAFSGTF